MPPVDTSEELVPFKAYLPASQVERLRTLSENSARSISWLISQAITVAWPVIKRFDVGGSL